LTDRVRADRSIPRVRIFAPNEPWLAETKLDPDIRMPGPIEYVPVEQLKLPPLVLRNHPGLLIDQLGKGYQTFGFLSVIVADQNDVVRAGVARLAAAKKIGLQTVPVVRTGNLSESKLRAFQLADNKLAEKAKWNRPSLSLELSELKNLLISEGENFTIDITGFEPAEIDQLTIDFETEAADPADVLDEGASLAETAVSRMGDLWRLGKHRLLCGDSRDATALSGLMAGRQADMAMLDPPYNRRVQDIGGRGRTKHAEFAMASGEMNATEFREFLTVSLGAAASVSRDGAVHYVFMDWRHLEELMSAGRTVYGGMLNMAVWVKSNAGQGSFYRSQHEHVGVFRVGKGSHLNNVQLGKNGRSRSNVWHYAGVNSFRAGRMEDLRAHPTVKPVALVCDAIRDCTRRDDLILDAFCGSGTTILAAERLGRCAVGVEIEPLYVDVAIRRWQDFAGKDAVHADTGRTFDEVSKRRRQKRPRVVA
jgi:DNA modification methylase